MMNMKVLEALTQSSIYHFYHSGGRINQREYQRGKIIKTRKELVGWIYVSIVLLILTTEFYPFNSIFMMLSYYVAAKKG